MGIQVAISANLQCSFGVAPGVLTVLPVSRTMTGGPAANIMDHVPMLNILPFGMCNCPSNPMVAAATAAALGVLTPMPCIPMTSAPWMPGAPTVMVGGMPSLQNSSKLMCQWGGVIQILAPGQFTVMVP
jgi:hypothetical protein